MSNLLKTVAAGALLAAGLTSATAVYAEQDPARDGSDSQMRTVMRHQGMMGMQGGMMDGCHDMMQGQSQPPNSQFHKPSQPRWND